MEIVHGNWNEMTWEHMRRNITRVAWTGEGATCLLGRAEPGHEKRPHSHGHEQIVIILEGEGWFHVGDDKYKVTAGSFLVIPPNVEHYLEVTGMKPVLDLDIFTPKRPEILESGYGAVEPKK